MNFPSTSSSQIGCTRNPSQRAFSNSREVSLKTSNPDIFPSLHPLSGFYRQNKTNNTNTAFSGHMEPQEPVKKIKVEGGRQAVVMNTNNTDFTRKSVKNEAEERKLKKTSEQDVFRVPKLPKRLLDKKNAESQKAVQNSFDQRIQEFQSVGGSGIDTNMLNYNMPVQQKSYSHAPIPFVPVNNENEMTQGMNPLLLNAFYENLKAEYFNYQLRQSLYNMYQLNQANALNMHKMQQQRAYVGF